jgi:hypothetical protein
VAPAQNLLRSMHAGIRCLQSVSPKGMFPCWQVEHGAECTHLLVKALGYSCPLGKQPCQLLQPQAVPSECC